MTALRWEAPGPGTWNQNRSHTPQARAPITCELYPPTFNRAWAGAFATWGVPMWTNWMVIVNGFSYGQLLPLHRAPEAVDREWTAKEFNRRVVAASHAFDDRIWRAKLERWDGVVKPGLIARHRALGDVDLPALDDGELRAHLDACVAELIESMFTHHDHNLATMIPLGDFLAHAQRWTGRTPPEMLPAFSGYSAVSGFTPPEMQPALEALHADGEAAALLDADAAAGPLLDELRRRIPAVDEYVRSTHYRVIDGFDILAPTAGEHPDIIVGRLRTAMRGGTSDAVERGKEAGARLRDEVPDEHRAAFDDLLAEARLVYRLRDERGVYADVGAFGLMRLALLELGRRLQARGQLHDVTHVLDLELGEVTDLCVGGEHPTADELAARAADRAARNAAGSPRRLGDPPPVTAPSIDSLPPSLLRLAQAMSIVTEGIGGDVGEPRGGRTEIIGIAGAPGVYEGPARLIRSVDELIDIEEGDVAVAVSTGEAFNAVLHLVGAMVTDHGSYTSHAAIVSREAGIPAVVGTFNATARIADGDRVRVDGTTGVVTVLPAR